MSRWIDARTLAVWGLSAGLVGLGLGLVARSQGSEQQQPPPLRPTAPLPMGFGTADSNGRMIAVTGVDVTGGSILYLIDTESRHISVYSAKAGTSSQSEVKWVGARNIDLDLQVDGFNDKSEYKYKELEQRFADEGPAAAIK
jgi:hypothetical protein